MNINQLIFRSLKKNIKNYFLYVFALIFSVSLYFSFVTLQYDPSMDIAKGSIKGGAAMKAASILLVAIVSIFLLYANTLFIKRRSKEIGLFQLIGLTKNKIFRILTMENLILYFSSLLFGIFIGFSFSKLFLLILIHLTGVNDLATLQFSKEAFVQTILVFFFIYLFIMLINFTFIKKQTILALFRNTSSTEYRRKNISIWEMIIGIAGLASIIAGYFLSSKLFDGDFTSINELVIAMISILTLVILGTYFFYKGSISFIANLNRKRKKGYLNINEVLSLSSIMFRMKSNSILLTIITTVSALAIGFLCLVYISYYSIEKKANESVPNQFTFQDEAKASIFLEKLSKKEIEYNKVTIPVLQVEMNLENILESNLGEVGFDLSKQQLPVISENSLKGIDIAENEVLFTGYSNILEKIMSFKDTGEITVQLNGQSKSLSYLGLENNTYISIRFTAGGLPTAVVDDTLFHLLDENKNPNIQLDSSVYIGIDMKDNGDWKAANDLFISLQISDSNNMSRMESIKDQMANMGVIIFIVGFLGLTFLITSGCILYFKQMGEGEEEKYYYTILRKLGFTAKDLVGGIKKKQLFNFGIPLLVGLLHSYFAVRSGWFFFGTELWTPMFLVMGLYALLYSIFGILSVTYYKKLIKEAL